MICLQMNKATNMHLKILKDSGFWRWDGQSAGLMTANHVSLYRKFLFKKKKKILSLS